MLDKITTYPPSSVGIIGGGQLGKMMTTAAKQMGFTVTILDPTPECPAAQVADRQVVANFTDRKAIRKLAQQCQVLTYEFEHIDSQVLIELVQEGHHIYPDPSVLQIIQNKLSQKKALLKEGIPLPAFQAVKDEKDILQAGENWGFPLLLKACTGGYDGKGNYLLKNATEIPKALNQFAGSELMVEAFVPFTCEISVIVARSKSEKPRTYPLSENYHKDNILRTCIIPARVSEDVARKAREIAARAMEVFQGIGVFCVEMFVTPTGDVLVNEVAPRPHNSGHYTIEACVTSQFEQHIRAIWDLPLGDTQLISPAVMLNLLGDLGEKGPAVLKGCAAALQIPGTSLHFYGKKETTPLRKMGHLTITAPTQEEALNRCKRAEGLITIQGWQKEE